MISAQEEAAVVQRSREFSASGFIPKSSPLETLQQAVRAVLDGDTWWPPQDAAAEALSEEAKAASAGLASLTPQQFRVLTMVCEGLLNKQIAYDLNVSEATVKAHVTAIFRKLNVRTRPRPRCCCNKWRRFPLLIERRLNAFFDQPAARLPAFRIDENPTCRLPPFKGQTGLKRILNATGYSLAGFLAAFRGEAAFRQLVLLNVVLIPVAFLLDVSRGERALMIAVCLLALIVELLNSAIEATVDRVSLERHPLSKNAMDMGSAAQFVALTVITVTWATILLG